MENSTQGKEQSKITTSTPARQAKSKAETTVGLVSANGNQYAGQHCIADFWGCSHLCDAAHIEASMCAAAAAANTTVLDSMLHSFPGNGVTGVVLLAESHISIHTWPELNYAAFDIFMCGKSCPEHALAVLKESFSPEKFEVTTLLRGKVGIAALPSV